MFKGDGYEGGGWAFLSNGGPVLKFTLSLSWKVLDWSKSNLQKKECLIKD